MTNTNAAQPTKAGLAMLDTMRGDERLNRWVALRNAAGEDAGWAWKLPAWDGAKLATAQKLDRDGFVVLRGTGRTGRFLTFTDAGRAAIHMKDDEIAV